MCCEFLQSDVTQTHTHTQAQISANTTQFLSDIKIYIDVLLIDIRGGKVNNINHGVCDAIQTIRNRDRRFTSFESIGTLSDQDVSALVDALSSCRTYIT